VEHHEDRRIMDKLEDIKAENLQGLFFLLLFLLMGSVSAAEILNLETYNELNFLATNQKYQN